MNSATTHFPDETRLSGATAVFAMTPLDAFLWKPRFLMPSPILAHVPFIFWLTAVLRPQRAIVLGCGDGVIQFALCQAMDRLVPGGKCHGYGYWSDPSSGKMLTDVPRKLREHQEMLYEGLSTTSAGIGPDDALAEIAATRPGLVCVDFEALPENAGVDINDLLHCLGDPGVLMLHGTSAQPVYGRRRIEIESEVGLSLLVKDGPLPAPLQGLLECTSDGKLQEGIAAMFRRGGQGALASIHAASLAESRSRAKKAQARAEAALGEAQEVISTLREGQDIRSRKLIELQAEIFDLGKQLVLAEQARGEAQIEETAELTRISEEWRAKSMTLGSSLTRLQQRLDVAHDKFVAQREKRLQTTSELKARIRKLQRQIVRTRKERNYWREMASTLETQVNTLLSSSSWRITRPLRWIRRAWTNDLGDNS